MKIAILVIGMVIFSYSTVGAQIDLDPDGIGIYADLEGTINSVDADVGTELSLYILATNITAENGIYTWQLSITWTVPDLLVFDMSNPFEYPYEASEWGGGGGPDRKVYAVNGPLPRESIMHLATVKVLIIGAGPADLFLKNMSGSYPGLPPTYVTINDDGTGRSVRLTPSSGSVDTPVFRINGPAPVATVSSEWGRVKSLFR